MSTVERFENKRGRTWVFTINNWTDEMYLTLMNMSTKYIIIGKEVGENGTRHLQGYVQFTNQVYHKTLNAKVKGYWDLAKGTPDENFAYCSKEGFFEEKGIRPISREAAREKGAAATQEKWSTTLQHAKQGNMDAINPELYIKHYQSLNAIMKDNIKAPDDLEQVTGYWLYGKAGCGKSHFARQNWPNYFLKNCNKWWDGYKQEENVIIDDFDKIHHVLGHYLKIWGDRYGFTPEVKGSVTRARPKCVIVTSNYHPSDIWEDNKTLQPIMRRFQVIKFEKINGEYKREDEGRKETDGNAVACVPYFNPPPIIPAPIDLTLNCSQDYSHSLCEGGCLNLDQPLQNSFTFTDINDMSLFKA